MTNSLKFSRYRPNLDNILLSPWHQDVLPVFGQCYITRTHVEEDSVYLFHLKHESVSRSVATLLFAPMRYERILAITHMEFLVLVDLRNRFYYMRVCVQYYSCKL